ncbi:MAG TPA: methyltransferase domain-containing protein [Pedobacter sp.]
MNNNYDPIARYYDVLSRMVFFRAQIKAQTDQLQFIPANSRILIAGGGTGWILDDIAKVHTEGLEITYVEISAKMLELSRKRDVKENTIVYVHAAAENFCTDETYDVIITAFLFDNFSAEKVRSVFDQFDVLLNSGGKWLFADFYYTESSGKKWQLFLLKTMYFFFKQVSNIEAGALINTEYCFDSQAYIRLKSRYYYGSFIKSVVYQKP